LLSIVEAQLFYKIDERAQVRYRVEDQRVDLTQQERDLLISSRAICTRPVNPPAKMYGTTATANQTALG